MTLCPPPDVSHAHGYIALTSPRLYFYQGRFVYPEGVEVTIACDDLYKLQGGTGRMQCLESGEWSRSIPRCGMSALHVYSVNLYDTIIMSNHSQISIGSYLRSIRGQTQRRLHKQFLCLFLYYMYVIQEDSMLLCICSEKRSQIMSSCGRNVSDTLSQMALNTF